MRPRAGPGFVAGDALHHVFVGVEHEAAGAGGGIEQLVVDARLHEADHELPDVVGRAEESKVFGAAGLGQGGLDRVPEQVALEYPVLVNLRDEVERRAACRVVELRKSDGETRIVPEQ